jgi:hypothetical protein
MANIKLVLQPILITDPLIITVEAVDNLGAEVTRQSFNPPHSQRNLTFPDLDPIMYRFFFWESSDGVALDTLLGSADIDGSLAFDFLLEIFEFKVDDPGAPASGQNQYRNASLLNCEILTPGVVPSGPAYTVQQRGVGQKFSSEITNVPDPGGFDLNGGDNFYGGDLWIVTKFSRVVSQSVASNAVYPADLITITAQVTAIDASHFNRELEFNGIFDVMTANFPDLATIADKKYFVLNTHRLTGNYLKLDFTAGGSIWYNRQQLSAFYIASGEELAIMIKGGVARIVSYDGNARTRGQVVADYKERIGYVLANGTEYTKAAAPGLYDFVLGLPPGVAVSFANWASSQVVNGETVYPYKSCYAIDVTAEKIKVPDMRERSIRFLKLDVDATRIVNSPGGFQMDRVGKFTGDITVKKGHSYTGGPNNKVIGNGGDDGNKADVKQYPATFDTGNTETTVRNAGQIPLVTL